MITFIYFLHETQSFLSIGILGQHYLRIQCHDKQRCRPTGYFFRGTNNCFTVQYLARQMLYIRYTFLFQTDDRTLSTILIHICGCRTSDFQQIGVCHRTKSLVLTLAPCRKKQFTLTVIQAHAWVKHETVYICRNIKNSIHDIIRPLPIIINLELYTHDTIETIDLTKYFFLDSGQFGFRLRKKIRHPVRVFCHPLRLVLGLHHRTTNHRIVLQHEHPAIIVRREHFSYLTEPLFHRLCHPVVITDYRVKSQICFLHKIVL